MRFDNTIAASLLVGAGLVHMVFALVTGHVAHAETPPELGVVATDVALDVWKSAALLVKEHASLTVVDVRPAEDYSLAHMPTAVSDPDADAESLATLAARGPVLVTAPTDAAALALVTRARATAADARIYYLEGGPRAWYLAFDLPVPLFSEAPPPRGYDDALRTVKQWLAEESGRGPTSDVVEAVQTLARLNYQPTLLGKAAKPKASGPRKKVSGGCG